MRRLTTLCSLLVAFALLAPAVALACGGFFCNAQSQTEILQAAERIVFARSDDGVIMHVEITYSGDPTQFGWILPLPAVPVGQDGLPKKLRDILLVSTKDLFDRLQGATQPSFRVKNTFEDSSCRAFPGGIVDAANSAAADAGLPSDGQGGAPPPVVVLQEANIGPFGAQLVQATHADALYGWLNDNGYLQDPKARPMLEHYVGLGYVFLGLRLQNGKAAGDIRPVELRLGPTDACVPLRLTAIAAAPNMPILIWVLGKHRAVPKNFLHAVVNPKAIIWPGGGNYNRMLSEAVDSASGRAFVTEYAGDDPLPPRSFYGPEMKAAHDKARMAEDLQKLIAAVAVSPGGQLSHPELVSVLKAHVAMPEGLKGYPFGDCYLGGGSGGGDFGGPQGMQGCEPNEEHETTSAEFYRFLAYWIGELEKRDTPLQVDLEALRKDLLQSWFEPRERIGTMLDGAAWTTRFFTTIDPKEMSRDPIFAFNADLPAVPREQVLQTVVRYGEDCQESWVEATYPNGSIERFECDNPWSCRATLGPVAGEPALLQVEVLDEQGPALPFDPEQVEEVDKLMDKAQVGKATLPPGFILKEVEDKTVTTAPPVGADGGGVLADSKTGTGAADGSKVGGGGCSAGQAGQPTLPLALLGVLLAALGLLRRRARVRAFRPGRPGAPS